MVSKEKFIQVLDKNLEDYPDFLRNRLRKKIVEEIETHPCLLN